MRCVIVLSGDILDDIAARHWLTAADRIICADGGARHLRRLNIRPDLLIGDMDSISPEDRLWLDNQKVEAHEFPAVKDQTDAELAIRMAMTELPAPREQHELVLLAALGNRPDHVLANQMLAASLAREGWRLILTDGVTTIYTLIGGQTLHLDLPTEKASKLSLSAIPVNGPVRGLTYQGLAYPLDQATLEFGSTRGVSNIICQNQVKVRLESGTMLVVLTTNK